MEFNLVISNWIFTEEGQHPASDSSLEQFYVSLNKMTCLMQNSSVNCVSQSSPSSIKEVSPKKEERLMFHVFCSEDYSSGLLF